MRAMLIAILGLVFLCGLCACQGDCGSIPMPPDAVVRWPIKFQKEPEMRPSGYVITQPAPQQVTAVPIAVQQPIQYVPVAPQAQPCR